MQVFALDGQLIGRVEHESDDWFLCRDAAGRKIRIRKEAIYFRERHRLVLICYRERVLHWSVDE